MKTYEIDAFVRIFCSTCGHELNGKIVTDDKKIKYFTIDPCPTCSNPLMTADEKRKQLVERPRN